MAERDPSGQVGAGTLIGRDKDLQILRTFLKSAGSGGASLLLAGAAGIGKTVLLDAAAEEAVGLGMAVLRARGAEIESEIDGAGLDQLLTPLHDFVPRPRADLRHALDMVLGRGSRRSVNRLTVASAVLDVLRERAAVRPLIILIDDLQWVDQASAVVLGMVARRLAGSRLGLLAAVRGDEESIVQPADLPRHELRPLDEQDAAELLDTSFPGLPTRVRRRLLTAAQGNPLALLELPPLLVAPRQSLFAPAVRARPLSRRLEYVFAGRIRRLPAKPRYLLLLAALGESGDPARGARIEWSAADLAPAEQQGLVRVDPARQRIIFRHPLLGPALIQSSTRAQRCQAHRVLAEATRNQPDRRAWHLAQSASGPDEQIAAMLELASHNTLLHGDAVSAVTALIHAADMSPSHRNRRDRLARAAYLGAAVTGHLNDVARLIDEARASDTAPAPSLRAVAASYVVLNAEGDIDTAYGLVTGSLQAQEGAVDPADTTLDAALHTLLSACFYGGRWELWEPFDALLDRLGSRVQPLLLLLRDTFADPARRAARAADRLAAAISALDGELDPTRIVYTATAAHYVGRTGECRHALWRVVRDGREGGAVTSAIDALMLLGFDSLWSGDWEEADSLIAECLRLCDAHGYRLRSWPGLFGQALLAAMRGEHVAATSGADRLNRWAASRGAKSLLAYAGHVRTIDQLGRGEFEEAYRQAAAVSRPGALAPYAPHAVWLIFDLVDAAVRTGRRAEALAHVEAARAAGFDAISPRLTLLTVAADAVAAPLPVAEELFEAALAIPGADRWVFDSARIRLAYGERLRRARATARAREQLLDAQETFQRLGAEPWAMRAGNELRATGYNVGRGTTWAAKAWPCRLTARDLEIASLAASGLSNKQIAGRLFLSDRTVSAHLYRLFPRLGITSRAALRDALDALPPSQIGQTPNPSRSRPTEKKRSGR
jgi:hypothetical protein